MSKAGSAVEQVNDFYLMAFRVMKQTNVSHAPLQPYCYKNKQSAKEDPRRERLEEGGGGDVNSVP